MRSKKKYIKIRIHQHNCICRFASREGWSLSSWNCEIWHSNTDTGSEIPRALDIDINGSSRHTCTSLCAWIECSTSLERNHYITSKQRKVAVFSSTFAWEYGSISVTPRLYSICLYVVYAELSAILRFVKISMSTIAFDRVNKSPSFCHKHCAKLLYA